MNMSRLCWVFVLVAVVVVVDARPHKCEQRERSIADLDLAEDSLNKAKLLYPNCGPHIPTEEPLTTTEEPEVTTQDFGPMDCQDWLEAGNVTSGVYSVWLRGGKSAAQVQVRCDMDTDGGGWTVIQRRGDFGKQEDFNRNWQDYKRGFGSLERDFWLGNDNIFLLTNQGNYSLRMDMTAADKKSAYAVYQEFRVQSENENYRLHVRKNSGPAGFGMGNFNNVMFTTKDRNNNIEYPANCAVERKGGFWCMKYNDTKADSNPNGLYKPGVKDISSMYYSGFKDLVGLSSIDMKLRRWSDVSSGIETK